MPGTIRIRIRSFALAADLLGAAETVRELPAGATVADLLAELGRSAPRLNELGRRLMTAVGNDYVERDRVLADGEEVVLIPPVSGG